MASHLDLEEQEQLDQIKHFWKQYGNPITWLLILVLAAYAGWNGYQYWQRSQAAQAASMYDEVEKSVRGGDPAKVERAFNDMKERFGSTTYAQQAGLLAAKSLYDGGKVDAAKAALMWVADKAADPGYASVARLRLAAVQMDAKSYDEALKTLDAVTTNEFQALAADRRGDILMAQGKQAEARAAYEKAYTGMEERTEYRRLVEVKLGALGVDVKALKATGTAK